MIEDRREAIKTAAVMAKKGDIILVAGKGHETYQEIKGVKYPAVLIRTGINDPRVVPWEPGKFAAILQNYSSSQNPVLLHVNYANGHHSSDLDVTFGDEADMYAFALWQVGDPRFQIKK